MPIPASRNRASLYLRVRGLIPNRFATSLRLPLPASSAAIINSRSFVLRSFSSTLPVFISLSTRIVHSCVTGAGALSVAEQAAPFLQSPHLFVDVNTASPRVMESVGDQIHRSGAAFADVAMLGGIPTFLHRVPCLASGDGAERFRKSFYPVSIISFFEIINNNNFF